MSLTPSPDCRIRIDAIMPDGRIAQDDSDAPFTILGDQTNEGAVTGLPGSYGNDSPRPPLRLLEPTVDATYTSGTTVQISWEPAANANHYDVYWTNDDGATYIPLAGNLASAVTAYAWLIDSPVASAKCRVKVAATTQSAVIIEDVSDRTFRVFPGTAKSVTEAE